MKIGVFHPSATEAGRLSVILARLGHKPVALITGEDVLEAVANEHFDALLMRWDGQPLSGVALMNRLRRSVDRPPPVVMLVDGQTPGAIADDADLQLEEPVSDADMARMLDQVAAGPRNGLVDGKGSDLQFMAASGQVVVRGHPVQLTAKEFALAQLLFNHSGQALSRDRIMGLIWGRPDQPGSRTLDAHIAQVRKRLALQPEHGWRLSSVYGFGYRLDRVEG